MVNFTARAKLMGTGTLVVVTLIACAGLAGVFVVRNAWRVFYANDSLAVIMAAAGQVVDELDRPLPASDVRQLIQAKVTAKFPPNGGRNRLLDGWGHEIRIDVSMDVDKKTYKVVIVSAGRDGLYLTEDDMSNTCVMKYGPFVLKASSRGERGKGTTSGSGLD